MGINKLIICLAISISLLILVYSPVSARQIIVDSNGSGESFKLIQEAVNNSSSGDHILVYPGYYNESVDIWIQNISVLSKSENPEDTTVRAFNVSENNITVSGFGVYKSLNLRGYMSPAGYDSCCPIENCTVKNNILRLGIYADECYNSTIEKNVVLNSGIGIHSFDTANFTISDNLIVKGNIDVYQGPDHCVLLNNTLLNGSIRSIECGYHKIFGNYISNSHEVSGISLWESYSNGIENNTVVNCSNGVSMDWHSSKNIVNNNTLLYNDKGIWIKGSGGGGNSLLNNTVLNNNIGIWVGGDSSNNLVANNKVELNKKYGVYLDGVADTAPFNRTNRFCNNIFNNTVNFFNDTGNYTGKYYAAKPINNGAGIFPVALNTTKTSGTNIVGGPYIGGNYWAKPDGTGFSQICADSDGDGICDLPYNITGNDTDYLPLVSVYKPQEPRLPVANFSTNITQNLAPLAIQFIDLSRNAIAWSWDFDNNGISDSTSQNPVHVYTCPGTYIINLTASNGKEISSKTQEIIVQEAKIPPVANFSINVTGGQVPLSVQFTDLSENATSKLWDFNNDGVSDSIERTPVYIYTYPGTYIVNLTVNNTKGTSSKSFTITVSPAQRLEGKLILTEFQVTTNESRQEKPAIYGDRIVWQDNRSGNYTIYLYNVSTSSETPIVSNYPQFDPTIYGDIIVWQSGGIYLYNLSTSTKDQITNQSGRYPAVYDNKIVWESSYIYMYDLSTLKKSQITNTNSTTSYQEYPAIFSNRIVWGDWRNKNWDIYMYDLSTQREFQITTNKSDQGRPAIYGDRIVWQDNRNGYPNLYMHNLSSSRETQITSNKSGQYWPAIYGDRIVWEDSRSGNGSDIYMYDLSTSKETRITTSSSAYKPKIYGNRIVWQDYRNGNPDIYMCIISEQEKEPSVADLSASSIS